MGLLPNDLAEALSRVRSVGAITGAGISAESGVPTYRGKGGLYDDPAEGDRTIEALSAPMLERDPDCTWRVIAALAQRCLEAKPNAGHHALVEIEKKVERFCLLTQNVDGLHLRAGSQNVIDIHGDRLATLCMECRAEGRLTDPAAISGTPRCPACEGRLRPGVVLFGEMLPVEKVARIELEFYSRIPDLVMIVGTTAQFPYIVMPVLTAAQAGKLTIEINPEETEISPAVEFSLRGTAGDFLPAIAAAIPRCN
jgi:NAD-dependent deacetylase